MTSFKKQSEHYSGKFFHSINAALEGIVHTLRAERNMRIHFLIGFFVLIAGVYLNLDAIEFILLCFAVTFVLVAEMVNTAVEHAMDLISKELHPVAKIVKDVSAGAVFVSAVNATIVGYILLFQRVRWIMSGGFLRIVQSPWHITLIAIWAVLILVIFIKVKHGDKSLLKGGMPSGHSALVFASWVVVSLITQNALVSILVFFMALLVAKSRMDTKIHTFWEVVAGSVLGALVALFAFQFFR